MDTNLSDTMPSAVHSTAAAGAAGAVKPPYTLLEGLKLASSVLSVARAVMPVARALRFFAPGGALALLGLARRRGPLATLALFGAGAVVGAGVGLLLAPSSGANLRSDLMKDPKKAIKAALSRVEGDVEGLANQARQGSESAERKIPWVSERTAAIHDEAPAKVDVQADTAKDLAAAAKRANAAPPDHEHAALVDSEAGKPTRANGAPAGGYRFG